jgi:hypothetical protein
LPLAAVVALYPFLNCSYLLPVCRAQGGPPKAITLATIEEAWKAREARVKGVRIKWKTKHHYPRGLTSESFTFLPKRLQQLNNPKGEVIPPRDTEFEVVSALVFDGKRVRYHTAQPSWSLAKGAYDIIPSIIVTDGKQEYNLTRNPQDFTPVGSITPPRGVFEPKDQQLLAIWFTIRGCTPPWRVSDLKKYALTSRKLLLNGAWCIEIEERVPRSAFVFRVWLDPAKECLVRRYSMVEAGRVIKQVDIRYAADPVAGWMPVEWDVVSDNFRGRALETSRAKVIECAVNPQVQRGDFTLPFPPGTQVFDRTKRRNYAIPGSPEPQGPPSLLDPGDVKVDQVPAANAGPEAPPESRSWLLPLFGGMLAVLIVMVAAYYGHRLLRRRMGVAVKRA